MRQSAEIFTLPLPGATPETKGASAADQRTASAAARLAYRQSISDDVQPLFDICRAKWRLGLYVVIAGYLVAGVAGALAGMLALATPALFAVPILRIVERGRASRIRGACSGIVIVSCMLMLATGLRLAPVAAPTVPLGVVTVVGFSVLAATRIPPVLVVASAAGLGLLLR